MSRLRITRPLFSDSATGKVSGLGSFRRAASGSYHLLAEPFPRRRRPSPNPALSAAIAEAKREHAAIPPTRVFAGGEWRWLILPTWADFWPSYLLERGLLGTAIVTPAPLAVLAAAAGVGMVGAAIVTPAPLAVLAAAGGVGMIGAAVATPAPLPILATTAGMAHTQNQPP